MLALIKDQKDKRKRFLQLTETGQKFKQQAVEIPNKIYCQFDLIDQTKTKQFMQDLDLVIND